MVVKKTSLIMTYKYYISEEIVFSQNYSEELLFPKIWFITGYAF